MLLAFALRLQCDEDVRLSDDFDVAKYNGFFRWSRSNQHPGERRQQPAKRLTSDLCRNGLTHLVVQTRPIHDLIFSPVHRCRLAAQRHRPRGEFVELARPIKAARVARD